MGRKKVEYKCTLCGYKTNRKSSYLNHKARTTPCIKKQENTNSTLESNLTIKIKENSQNKEDKLELLLQEYKKKLIFEKEKYKLKLENKDESIKDLIKANKDLISTNKVLVNQSKELKESIKINMSMHNYFIVNSFGKEDLNYIDMKKLLYDYKTLAQMVAKQIQLKHFSKHKQNHNLMLYRSIYKTYSKEGIWEPKDNVKLFIVNELIKKGVVNIDDYKKSENIEFEVNKEKMYKKDKKLLLINLPLACMFNPLEATKRLNQILEQKEVETDPIFEEQWVGIEQKYKTELNTAQKQLDVKSALISHLNKAIKNKYIKASVVKFKNY